MDKSKWVWMPHAAHFICADRCLFRLATYVGGYIVSTIGEMRNIHNHDKIFFEEIGFGRKYESFVFFAKKQKDKCGCQYVIDMDKDCEIDSLPANDPETAYKNHIELCEKWSKKETP